VLARKRRGLPDEEGGRPSVPGTPAGASPAPESELLGGPEAEPKPLPAGTAEAPGDPVPDRGA
jgi:hypothetical protein